MKRMLSLLGVLVFALVATYVTAAPKQEVPGDVMINAAASKKPGVAFPHGKHATELVKSCDTCHHQNPGLTADTAEGVKACSECHLKPAKADVPDMAQMSMKKNPFHMVCINCHRQEKKGPTSCNDCHVKT